MSERDKSLAERIHRNGVTHFGASWAPKLLVRAPGRIELIGNHVDYNGGPVLAAAIDREIHVAAQDSGLPGLRVIFADVSDPGPFEVQPDEYIDWRIDDRSPGPTDYLRGVIGSLTARGLPMRTRLNLLVAGNLPTGIGISSSAALCVALTLVLAESRPADGDLVLIAQEAEHRVGSPCGTMDQSASVAGGLIAYSGADNSVTPMPAELGDVMFVVINSGVERNLATSSYPDRVRESRAALAILRETVDSSLRHLAEIKPEALAIVERSLFELGEATLAARVRHVVTECLRVEQAKSAVEGGDWTEIGRLMTASGRSSSRDYAISHPRVDDIVRISLDVQGVLGARMMGGGEGGAALALVLRDALNDLSTALEIDYFDPRGMGEIEPKIVPSVFAQGADRVELSP